MTHSMTTPIATVAALAAVTLFMIVSLLTVGTTSNAQLASAPAAVATHA